jgi:AhpD family alkylhydroperoxidase
MGKMEPRMNFFEKGNAAFMALGNVGMYLMKSPLGQKLLRLVYLRVSQINGCAFCLDMHWKELREAGESEQRLYGLSAWKEAPYYTNRERAALAWAESVTNITDGHVSDEVYKEARKEFSEEELIDLTFGVIAINSYTRINIAFRAPAGTYRIGQFGVKKEEHPAKEKALA